MPCLTPECRSAFDSLPPSGYAAATLISHEQRCRTALTASANDSA